jgi:hypothetical protein
MKHLLNGAAIAADQMTEQLNQQELARISGGSPPPAAGAPPAPGGMAPPPAK